MVSKSWQKVKCVYWPAWEDYSIAGETVGKHTRTDPNSIVEGNELSCFPLKAPDENLMSGIHWLNSTRLCKQGAGQDENRSSCHYAAPFISQAAGQGLRMSQDLLSLQVSQCSENVSSCSHTSPHEAYWMWSHIQITALGGLITFSLFGSNQNGNEKRFMQRMNASLIWHQPKPQPWAITYAFGLPALSVFFLMSRRASKWSQRCLGTPLRCALPTLLLYYPSLPFLSPSLFLSLRVVNKSEAPNNQTVNSTHLANDIIHSMNLVPSLFALTTLSSLKKILSV